MRLDGPAADGAADALEGRPVGGEDDVWGEGEEVGEGLGSAVVGDEVDVEAASGVGEDVDAIDVDAVPLGFGDEGVHEGCGLADGALGGGVAHGGFLRGLGGFCLLDDVAGGGSEGGGDAVDFVELEAAAGSESA